MANPLAAACRTPFSNGTEERAWQAKWCEFCAHDHGAHTGIYDDSCTILADMILTDYKDWPEAWLPEPDDGRFSLPSRMICGQFTPCTSGECTGDPGAEARAERVAEVTVYWRDRRD